MLVLTASDVERLLTIRDCIPAMRSAMVQLSSGQTRQPLRQFMAIPGVDGKLGLMPGWLAEPPRFGVKIVSKYVRAPTDPHGTHVGAVMLFDAATGLPIALIEGGSLTATLRWTTLATVKTRLM